MTAARLLLVLYTLAAAGACAAQTIYRCGNSYSEQSCLRAQVVPVPEAPSESERAEAEQRQQRHTAVAEELRQRRLQQEAEPIAAGGIRHTAADARQEPPASARAGQRNKGKKGGRRDKANRNETVAPGAESLPRGKKTR